MLIENIAADIYAQHPNYAQKIIHKYPAPLVDPGSLLDGPGDLPGIWYECIYQTVQSHKELALDPSKRGLLLTIAYRRMIDDFRARNTLRKSDFLDENASKHKKYEQLSEHIHFLIDDGFDDDDEDYLDFY